MFSVFSVLIQFMAILALCESRTLYRDVTAQVTKILLKIISNKIKDWALVQNAALVIDIKVLKLG